MWDHLTICHHFCGHFHAFSYWLSTLLDLIDLFVSQTKKAAVKPAMWEVSSSFKPFFFSFLFISRTPLHCAASCNNVQVCKFLVESGAAVFATTYSDMQTAADKCEEMEDGYTQCSQFLYGERKDNATCWQQTELRTSTWMIGFGGSFCKF